MTRYIDMNEAWTLFDFDHARTVNEFLKRAMIAAQIMNSHKNSPLLLLSQVTLVS